MRWTINVCPECDKVLLGQDPSGLPGQCGWCKAVLRTRWEPAAPEPIAVEVVPVADLDRLIKDLTLICEFTQEHGDWSKLPAGKAMAKVHNIARASLEETL